MAESEANAAFRQTAPRRASGALFLTLILSPALPTCRGFTDAPRFEPNRATPPSSRYPPSGRRRQGHHGRIETALLASFLQDLFPPKGKAPIAAADPPPIETSKVLLDSGTLAEVVTCVPPASRRWSGGGRRSKRKPLSVFVHGSFHAAWCWTERYFPYFAARGYPVAALSLRGTGGTPAGVGVRKVKIDEHVDDLAAFLSYVVASSADDDAGGLGLVGAPNPVLVAHSFGGIAVMRYLERDPSPRCRGLSGVALLCSVPPSGNSPMTLRYLRRSLVDSWKITAGMALKKCNSDASLCRTLFFGGDKVVGEDGEATEDWGVSDEDVARYQSYFVRDTAAMIDLADLSGRLPSKKCDRDGRAPFVTELPPALVIGASDDFIVDWEGVEETARYLGIEARFVDSPHDVMLGGRWRNGADALLEWLEEEVCEA